MIWITVSISAFVPVHMGYKMLEIKKLNLVLSHTNVETINNCKCIIFQGYLKK